MHSPTVGAACTLAAANTPAAIIPHHAAFIVFLAIL
jgi:hypothetical protein